MCVEHNVELRKTNAAVCRGKHNAALHFNPDQDFRMAMHGDLEWLVDDEGFKHIGIQIQRRSERDERTLGMRNFPCGAAQCGLQPE